MNKHPREIGEHLKYLVNQKWLIQDGHGRGTRYRLANRHFKYSNIGSGHLDTNSGHLDTDSGHYEKLMNIAAKVRVTGKADKNLISNTIIELCSNDYLTIKQLAELLNRQSESLRKHYINPMVNSGLLELRYPDRINHPQQGYKASDSI